jgi:phenylpyruvate tautomerase PptA (4-oxalocrotonate tautomerase family)
MPLVRIDVLEGRYSADERRRIGEAVYQGLRAIGVPVDDRFQVIAEHRGDGLIFDRGYLGIVRSDGFVAIQITFNAGRSLDQKRTLYKTIADGLAETVEIRREDVFVSLVEVPKENWSFGNGEAQYA